MEILLLGNELLRQKAEAVAEINEDIAKLAADMIEAMHEGKGVGLAGPQVGVMKRIFVMHAEGDIPRVFINPSIVGTSEEQVTYEEGCLSIPGMYTNVKRPGAVRVQAWNEKGRRFILDAEGLVARIIQHEYDHLEGILFIDRISEVKRNRISAKFEKHQRA
ncbi:MAG: peptide deformylase [Spirochaetaceae bacterium]|jgi:peptide deformylase|nr:peptide deformylase [Spirochaetaceae bacterium]